MKEAINPFSDVERIVLDNGLTVLLLESHRANTASIYLGVRSGSADEIHWQGSGLSHFVEHMFFKGTPSRDKGIIESQVREMGGYINAYTSHDITVFYTHFLADYLPQALDLMSDAAFNSVFDKEELEKEREVIVSEQRMNEDRISRKALMNLWETMFLSHPYRHPVIGYPELFTKVSREDLLAFYQKFYVPNNMVLTVVGNFDTQETAQLVKQYFGGQVRGILPELQSTLELPQIGPRLHVSSKDAQHARFLLGVPGVPVSHPDAIALDLFSQILGEGNSSRLYQSVKEESDLVLEINASNTTLESAGMFIVEALLKPENIDATRLAIEAEIKSIQENGVEAGELQRIRSQVLSQLYQQWETSGSLAHDLVTNEIYTGDFAYTRRYIQMIEGVKSADIQRVAKQYWRADKMNEIRLLPAEISSGEKVVQASKPQRHNVDIHKVTLPNGIRLLLHEDHASPTIEAQVAMMGGVYAESAMNAGISNILSELLVRGTSTQNQKQIAETVAQWGGDFSGYSGQGSLGLSLSVLSQHEFEALDLLAEALIRPSLPPNEIEKVKQNQLEELLSIKEDIYSFGNRELMRQLYANHPYEKYNLGSAESIASVGANELKTFHHQVLNPKQMVVAVFGDIDIAKTQQRLTDLFSGLGSDNAYVVDFKEPRPIEAPKVTVHNLPREQALTLLGFHAVDMNSEDRYGFEILNTILTGSAGRLYRKVRQEAGLSYVVGAGYSPTFGTGTMSWYAASEPSQAEAVAKIFLSEVKELRDNGILQSELKMAKTQIQGQQEALFESKVSLLRHSLSEELFGKGYDELDKAIAAVERITLDDIHRIIKTYVNSDYRVQVLITP